MRCLGRTKNRFAQCKNHTRFLFCKHHWFQPVTAIFAVFSVIAVFAGLFQDLYRPIFIDNGEVKPDIINKVYFNGTWKFVGFEKGEVTEIIIRITDGNKIIYERFTTNGEVISVPYPVRKWSFADQIWYEELPNGMSMEALIRNVKANSFELTVVDNTNRTSRGKKRVYVRL